MESNNRISEIKKCITFIFYKNAKGERIANGTGFFVSVGLETMTYVYVVYLVSAKHVLLLNSNEFFPEISIRLNKREGGVEYIDIPMTQVVTFEHDDPDVDLIAIPITPFFPSDFPRRYDFMSIDENMIIKSTEDMRNLGIKEGDDVFFSGLFVSHIGQKQNQPITRFGKIALIPDEKIEYDNKKEGISRFLDLYLIECLSFGGNSGAPVFFSLSPLRNLRRIKYLDTKIYFAGIIMGSFEVTEVKPSINLLLSQNVGIAAVVPSHKLYEILVSDIVRQNRNNATQYARYT